MRPILLLLAACALILSTGCVNRVKVLESLHPGASLTMVEEEMKEDPLDRRGTFEGLKFRFYYVDKTKKRVPLCFHKDRLIGLGEGPCQRALEEIQDKTDIELEKMFLTRLQESHGTRLDIPPRPILDDDPFSIRDVVFGDPLHSIFRKCPGAGLRKEVQPDDLSFACYMPFYTDPGKAYLYRLPDVGVEGTTYVILDNGKVDKLYFLSNRYNSQEVGNRLLTLIQTKYGEPGFYEQTRVGDSRGRFHLKFMAFWNIDGNLVYLTSYAERSGRAILMVTSDHAGKVWEQKKHLESIIDNL